MCWHPSVYSHLMSSGPRIDSRSTTILTGIRQFLKMNEKKTTIKTIIALSKNIPQKKK